MKTQMSILTILEQTISEYAAKNEVLKKETFPTLLDIRKSMYFLVDKGFMKDDEIDDIEELILSRWNDFPAVGQQMYEEYCEWKNN